MQLKNLIGRKITGIFECPYNISETNDGLNCRSVILLLDDLIYVNIPFHFDAEVTEMKLPDNAISLCSDTQNLRRTVLDLTTHPPKITKEIRENPLKNICGQRIVDILIFEGPEPDGWLELENGMFITEEFCAPEGVGNEGLNYVRNLRNFEENIGTDYLRFSSRY